MVNAITMQDAKVCGSEWNELINNEEINENIHLISSSDDDTKNIKLSIVTFP